MAFASLSSAANLVGGAVSSVLSGKEYSFEEIPDSQFPERYGNRVSLFQDGHVGDPLLPPSIAREELEQDAFDAIYKSILEAKIFILITGWSVDTDTCLLRYPEQDPEGKRQLLSLGQLLLRKAHEGVKVQIHVWDELASVDVAPGVKFAGMMGTSDEKTAAFFKGSPVEVLLSYRDGPGGTEKMFFTHHQKTVIVDAPLESEYDSTLYRQATCGHRSTYAVNGGNTATSRPPSRRRRNRGIRNRAIDLDADDDDEEEDEEEEEEEERSRGIRSRGAGGDREKIRRRRKEMRQKKKRMMLKRRQKRRDDGDDDDDDEKRKKAKRRRKMMMMKRRKRRKGRGDDDDDDEDDDDDDDKKKRKKRKGKKGKKDKKDKKNKKKRKKRKKKDDDDEEEEEEEEEDICDDNEEEDDFDEEEEEDDVEDEEEEDVHSRDSRPTGATPCRHRPNSHGLDSSKRRVVAFVGGLDLTGGRWDVPGHPLFSSMGVEHARDFYQGWALDPTMGPRQPWHDIHSMVEGPVARDVLENFVQRWKKQGKTPAFNFDGDGFLTSKEEEQYVERTMQGATTSTPWGVRLLRSIDEYSAVGVEGHEAGIQKAYITAIRNCKRFIYIENQYFMGSAHHWHGNPTVCFNLIPYEIAMRIARGIDEQEPIYAYIVVPLFPEGLPDSGALQEVLRWQWKTIDMMYTIVSQALQRNGVNHHPQNYLNFYCPGNREEPSVSTAPNKVGDPAHPLETALIKSRRFMIYVHSKMMIVDDEDIIVGSANINERSMAGDRDTEIAILAHQSSDHGRTKEHKAAVHRFRLSLWVEHCGRYMPEFDEPNSDACLLAVNTIADQNWAQFISPKVTDMSSHLMHYPLTVGQDGTIRQAVPHFPESTGSIQGNRNHMLPDKVTT